MDIIDKWQLGVAFLWTYCAIHLSLTKNIASSPAKGEEALGVFCLPFILQCH